MMMTFMMVNHRIFMMDRKDERNSDVDVEMYRSTGGLAIMCSINRITYASETTAFSTGSKSELTRRPPTMKVAHIFASHEVSSVRYVRRYQYHQI